METYYLSLVNGLNGYYVKFTAPNEWSVRRHAGAYYGKIWCSVYSEAYFMEILRRKFGASKTKVVNAYSPIRINEDGELL